MSVVYTVVLLLVHTFAVAIAWHTGLPSGASKGLSALSSDQQQIARALGHFHKMYSN